MAKKKMLESECDRCHVNDRRELPKGERGKHDLPPGWLHIQADTRTKLVFQMDLCGECKTAVLAAAGAGLNGGA